MKDLHTNTFEKFLKIIFAWSLFFSPICAFAAFDSIKTIITSVGTLVNLALPIAFGLALLFFFWGIARFVLAAGNPGAKNEGRGFLIWSVIAMFVLVSIWGLVQFIGTTLGIDTQTAAPGSVMAPLGTQ